MSTINFRPHLLNCDKSFKFSVAYNQDIRTAVMLILMYKHLGDNSHSQPAYKSRLEFLDDKGQKIHNDKQTLHSVNHHRYMDMVADGIKLEDCPDAKKFGLRLSYAPNIPCDDVFYFPVKDLEEAVVLYDALTSFNNYLFTDCQNMRADYADMFELEALSGDGEWESWSSPEDAEDFFFDFRECYDHVMEMKEASEA